MREPSSLRAGLLRARLLRARLLTWLRLLWAAVLVWLVARPRIRAYAAAQWRAAVLLGAAMAMVNVGYYQSLLFIPIGVATAIEFLGPLSIAAFFLVRTRPSAIVWPLAALAGVILLTTAPSADMPFAAGLSGPEAIGAAWALLAALGWGAYVVFMKRTGHLFAGLEGLAISLAAAALVTAPFALVASGGVGPPMEAIGTALWLAVLVPLLPYALEMVALRRMDTRVFGILTSVEPVIAVVIGWLVLGQALTVFQLVGVALVTIAMARVMQLQSGLR